MFNLNIVVDFVCTRGKLVCENIEQKVELADGTGTELKGM